jgi:hypothetical protein
VTDVSTREASVHTDMPRPRTSAAAGSPRRGRARSGR